MSAAPDSTFADPQQIIADLRRQLAERTAERDEALQRETATAEVLQVINASPNDLAPVFDAMLEKAMRLCEAHAGYFLRFHGGNYVLTAGRGLTASLHEYMRHMDQPRPGEANTRVLEGAPYVHALDQKDEEAYRSGSPLRCAVVNLGGFRTGLTVPLRKDNELLGTFNLARFEVRPFSKKQIALVQNFAAQAVIAMENARLITELRQRTRDLQESLEHQTATSDVLKVISRSTFDLQPVLDTLVETAARICRANSGFIFRLQDGLCRMVASFGIPSEYRNFQVQNPIPPGRSTLAGRTVLERRAVHIEDAAVDREYARAEAVQLGHQRTMLGVPLIREEALIGVITLARSHVEPFTEKQIGLVTTFADQAIIAIEDARLLNELRARTEELTRREDELRITFENMGDGVAMFDQEQHLAAWNRNFQEITELPDAVFSTRPSYADYLRMLAERGEFGTGDIEAELSRRLEGTDQELRLERARPDGRVIEVRRNSVPGGGFVLIYSDITERKRAEEHVRAARDAAEVALRELQAVQANLIHAQKMAALGQLTAGIAHEIKNPLNFVNNFAGLSMELLGELKESAASGIAMLDEDTRADIDETIEMLTGNLDKIAEHGKRADNIVKSMLEHSRGVSGEHRAVDLNALVDEALNLAYHGARAQDQSFNISLERDYASTLMPIELAPQEITRVCLNLFGNGFYAASKRQREGNDPQFKPTLKVMTRNSGEAVEIRIRDNGTGIPPEIKDKLFQPFFTTKPTGEGTGLGLSISYDIVTQQHGGTITVESEPGAYTDFTIRLPRRAAAGGTA